MRPENLDDFEDECAAAVFDSGKRTLVVLDDSIDQAIEEARRRKRGDMRARTLLTRAEAAEMLAMSLDSFERYVQPHIDTVRKGKLVLVPRRELENWVANNSHSPRHHKRRRR